MSPSLERSSQVRAPHEIKFLVPADLADKIRVWASEFMEHDPHTFPELDHAYRVQSIYLDTPQFDVFHKRGSFGRGKYRVREYLPAGILFLERKLKAKGVVRKRRTLIAIAELERLLAHPDKQWPGFWYHRRLELRQLRPVCAISYLRHAFISGKTSDEPLRLTIDQQLSATPVANYRFPFNGELKQLLPGKAVLELKYLGETPGLFKTLGDQFALTPEPVSKYRLALPALGLAERIRKTEPNSSQPVPLESPIACA